MLNEADNLEAIEGIRARLKSYKCSFCGKWITKKENRPDTCSLDNGMCDCKGKGIHNSLIPDVNDEDVEFLLEEVDRLRKLLTP